MEKTSSKLLYRIFLITLIFGTIFYNVIELKLHFTYIDELLAATLFSCSLIWGDKKKSKEFVLFIIIALFYLVYSLAYPNNVKDAIYTDFIIQIKPFIAFYGTLLLCKGFKNSNKAFIRKVCIWCSVLLLPVAFSKGLTLSFFGHPSRLASTYEILGIVYLYFSDGTKRKRIISCVIVGLATLSLRSKAIAFVGVYFMIVAFGPRILKRKNSYIKKVVFFICILTVSINLAWDKIYFYFIEGSQAENIFARPALYLGALQILKDYPLLGTGLGTYANYASAVYYSPIYVKYNLDLVAGLSNIYEYGGGFLADTFFPELAQFGIIGIILFFSFWIKRYKESRSNFIVTRDTKSYLLSISIFVFFIIESVADSTFLQNRGFMMMMILSIILNSPRKTINNR